MSSPKRYISNIILFLGSLAAGLYISEYCLLLKDYIDRHPGGPFDPRTRFEIYRDLKQKEPDTTIYVSPTNWRNERTPFYPLSGISHRKSIHCNENGYYSIYQSDRYGFNNPDAEWDKSPVDYLLVGDSYAQGACVNEPDTISGNLRRLSKKSVLTLGMGGSGPITELALLREYFQRAKAKTVFWVYFEGNDLYDLNRELWNDTLKRYLEQDSFSQGLVARQAEIDEKARMRVVKWESENSSEIANFLRLKTLRNFVEQQLKRNFLREASSPEVKQILIKASEAIKKENAKFVFVYIPSSDRYKGRLKNSDKRSEIIHLIERLNIPMVDIHSEFLKQASAPITFFSNRNSYHLNEQGYRIVAEALFKYRP